jgi:D-glycero-D-manno-heptose 1,7-bisphosphate phosphatase
VIAARAGSGGDRAAVFLDRDGTLIVDRHYLGDPAGVELLPGAGAAVRALNEAGIPVILVTNQSGIGRGYFTEEDFRAVQLRLDELLSSAGARLDGVYHCPHAPDADPACDCRKPRAGLFRRAAAERRLDLSRSWYVGDRMRDVEPADRFGGRGILVDAEAGRPSGGREPMGTGSAEPTIVPDLARAVETILAETRAD